MADKVLVTGASGFTGRLLCSRLVKSGYEVVSLSGDDALKTSELLVCDLRDSSRLVEILQTERPDYVIHLGAVAFVATEDVSLFYEINVIGTCNLLDAVKTIDVKKAVIASSANIYGVPMSESPINESHPASPVNHYGASKLSMEHLIRSTYSDIPYIITRPFNYTGIGQNEVFLIPKIVKHFRERRANIELGNLSVTRDFTSVNDVVDAYVALIESDVCYDTYNVCSGESTSLDDLLGKLTELSGHEIDISSTDSFVRKTDIPVLVGDGTKLREATGWDPKESVDDILTSMLMCG